MEKWSVYLSSTYQDLHEIRAGLLAYFDQQLSGRFDLTRVMEHMYNDGKFHPFQDDCAAEVRKCDIYILILGNRVGSYPPGETRTYTEIELDTALAHQKRIFCFLPEAFDLPPDEDPVKHAQLVAKTKGRPVFRFRDAQSLKLGFLECLIQFAGQQKIDKRNPYKGLSPFETEDGRYFFGRDGEVENCLKKLLTLQGRILSIVGNSGIGKTSFVQAGVLYRIASLPGWSDVKQIILNPGSEPYGNLLFQLEKMGISVDQDGERVFACDGKSTRLLVFLNQFEEIITQCTTPEAIEERRQLFELLGRIRRDPTNHVLIASYRSDFISQIANFELLHDQQLFALSSLDDALDATHWMASIRAIIAGPAALHGVTITEPLLLALVNGTREIEGSLPILQLTLEQLWQHATLVEGRIDSADFDSLAKGKGMAGILETHAGSVVDAITAADPEKEKIVKALFTGLVQVGTNLIDIRRTADKDRLLTRLRRFYGNEVDVVFDTLVRKRLLTLSEAADGVTNVDIIHEVLIRKWERLRGWINERRTQLEKQAEYEFLARQYVRSPREERLLHRRQIGEVESYMEAHPDIAWGEAIHVLLAASRKRQKKKRRVMGIAAVFGGALLCTGLFSANRYNEKQNLEALFDAASLHPGTDPASVHTLRLENYDRSAFPQVVHHFTRLDTLIVRNSEILDVSALGKLPRLRCLIIEEHGENGLRGLDALGQVTSLHLSSMGLVDWRQVGGMRQLRNLDIADTNCSSLLPLGNLHRLERLSISGSRLRNLDGLSALGTHIRELTLSGCGLKSADGIQALLRLERLDISDNPGIRSIDRLASLPMLKFVYFRNSRLADLRALARIRSLEELVIEPRYDRKQYDLHDIAGLPRLRSLTINADVKGLNAIGQMASLRYLKMYNCDISALQLKGMPRLAELHIATDLRSFDQINQLAGVKRLVLDGQDSRDLDWTNILGLKDQLEELVLLDCFLSRLDPIAGLQLKKLTLDNYGYDHGVTGFRMDFTPIARMKATLEELKITHSLLASVGGIDELERLHTLEIHNVTAVITDMPRIASLAPSLKRLSLDNVGIRSLEGIDGLAHLESLTLVKCEGITDWTRIARLAPILRHLSVIASGIETLEPFQSLSRLEKLDLSRNPIADWGRMGRHESVRELTADSAGVDVLRHFDGLPRLRKLQLYDSGVSLEDYADYSRRRPDVRVLLHKEE